MYYGTKNMRKFILFSTILNYLIATVPALKSLVNTSGGPVRGKLNKYKNTEYYTYYGIPFAESPTGSLRFMPPVPRRPWTNVLDATHETRVCAQMEKRHQVHQMSEDCLKVNIYAPVTGVNKLLPVLVFVHGGALKYLSCNADYLYGPQFILERDIIVVGINYRLGPLGFLSLEIKEASGNAALKDILLSLKWIKQNILQFGGNPKNVTLIGHSSGAVLINFLMLTKKSDGLFEQVILLSGSALSPRVFARHPKEISLALARELGLETVNVYDILKFLQNIDVHKILKAYDSMGKGDDSVLREFAAFVPSKEIESSHAIITVDPILFFKKYKKLPIKVTIMAGISAQEGLIMLPNVIHSPKTVGKLREQPENCIPSNIEYPINSPKSKQLGRSIAELYFDREETDKRNTIDAVVKIISDTQYVFGIHYWIKQFRSVIDDNPLYYYLFDFDGDLNWAKVHYNIRLPGTAHSDEMGYIFITNVTKSKIASANAKSHRMINTMMDFLANFIYYGNPTPSNSLIKWPDYGQSQTYLLISDNLAVKNFTSCELSPRMQFWETAYDNYYKYIKDGGEIRFKIYP